MKKMATFFVGTLAATMMFAMSSCSRSDNEEIVSSIPDKMVVHEFTVPATTTQSTPTTTKAEAIVMQMHNVKETSAAANTTNEQTRATTVVTVTTVIPNANQNKEEKPVQNNNTETNTQTNNSNNVANNNSSNNDSTWENNYSEAPNSYTENTWNQSTYTVKAGDCWSSIAESNGVWPPERLAEANNLTVNDPLMVGDKLIIPSVYEDYNETPSWNQDNYQNNYNTNQNDWYQNSSNQSNVQSSGTCIGSSWLASAPDWASWNNIQVSMNQLNGLTLAPGEYFNWDSYIGWMTADSTGVAETGTNPYGYVSAGVFVGTENGTDVGGGICVTSTALMQCARDAGMTIVEKHDHSKRVGYAVPGDEASVSYGALNLVFANTTGSTVVFYTSASYGSVSVSCYIA